MSRNSLALAAIVKNEDDDIEEFVAHHITVGFDHLYVYDNDSSNPVKNILKNYIDAGVVTVIDFPGHAKQLPAYVDAIRQYRYKHDWLALIDADEFITPVIQNNVKDVLSEYKQCVGLHINWKVFGSQDANGENRLIRPNGLLQENYKHCHNAKEGKCICRPTLVTNVIDPHFNLYYNGTVPIYQNYAPFRYKTLTIEPMNKIQINHYFSKDYETFIKKVNRGCADGMPQRTMNQFEDHNKEPKYIDIVIDRFTAKTKEIIAQFKNK